MIFPGSTTVGEPRHGICSQGLSTRSPEIALSQAGAGGNFQEKQTSPRSSNNKLNSLWAELFLGQRFSPTFSSRHFLQFLLDCPELMVEVAVKSTDEGRREMLQTEALQLLLVPPTVSALSPQLRRVFPEELQPFLSAGIIPQVRPHSGNLPHPPHVPQALHVPGNGGYNPYFKTSMASVPSGLVKWSP